MKKSKQFLDQPICWGTWISTGSPVVAELASQYPFDWLLIDFEHGAVSDATLPEILRGISHHPRLSVIIRVPDFQPSLIARALDWGADGIMLPHVRSAQDAARCVAAMRYPPRGKRGYSSSVRAYGYGVAPPTVPSDIQPLLFTQIEDLEGVNQAQAIAAVDGVDVLFVGPADLKMALEASDAEEKPTYGDALQRVSDAANAYGKRSGILVRDQGSLPQLLACGYTCIAIDSDIAILRAGYERLISARRS